MATGIQTGMRSGSRAGLTGRSAAKGGGPLGKFQEIWGGLGKGAKVGIGVLLVLVVLGGGFFAHQSSSNAFVPLYTTELTPTDKKEVAMKLTELGIDHRVDIVDGILLHPSHRAKAQVALAAHGLPRHPIMTADKSSAMTAKTSAEQKALRQRILEGELTETIRQVEGVADAYVKLAIPEETYFRDDSRQTTARVLIKMQPGSELNRQSIGGLVHLISFAVPDLQPEGVKIIDSTGRDLTAMLPKGPNGEGGMGGAGTQHETKTQVEKDLETKVQEHLDTILGPGRAKASVNAELDFAHFQKTTKSYGGAGDNGTVIVGKQHKVEKFNKDPHRGASQSEAQMMSSDASQTSTGTGDKNNYVNETTVTKVKADERTVTTVDKSYRIKRLTCSVTVDNLRDDMRSKVAGIVRSAIGIDEARGDEVVVESLPFHRETAMMPAQDLTPPGGWGSQAGAPAGLNTGHLTAAVTVGAAIFLGLIVMFLVKQNQVHNNQRKPILASGGGATSTGIADLLNEKSGKSTAAGNAGETKVNTTDQLEQLAKERPTKVAEMLKSTWLSG